MSRLHAKFGEKGLLIVALHRQSATDDEIRKVAAQATYPIASGGHSYNGGGGLPYAYLVGVDGKVLFKGNPGSTNIDKQIEDEVAKIKYPGLGKLDVHARVAKAAQHFAVGEWDKAREAAKKEIEKLEKKGADGLDDDDKLIKADAEFVIERVTSTHGKLEGKAKGFESTKHYVKARAIYEKIILGFGKKSKEGEAADERLTAFKKDKDIKKEIKAEEELAKLDESLAKKKPEEKAKAYADFAKKNEGTQAAADALTRVKE